MARRRRARRGGRPGVVGTMARTAVVAGTASAVVGHSQNKRANKAQTEYDQQASQQAAYESQAQVADMQRQMDEMAAQQAAPAPAAAPAAAPAGDDMIARLGQLGDLHTAGILSDAEFASAKAKLLG